MAGIAWPKPHGKAGLRSKPSSLIEILSRIMLVSDRTSCLIEADAQTTQRRRPRGAAIGTAARYRCRAWFVRRRLIL